MKIQFTTNHWGETKPEVDDISWWIERNMDEGGIEKKIDKLLALVSIIAVRYLEQYPEDLDAVVDAIRCPYTDHKLIGDNE